jgi:2'-5' RNA ligase
VEKLLSLIEKEKDVELNGFDASCVHLMQSQLRPTGAVYTELYAAPLNYY